MQVILPCSTQMFWLYDPVHYLTPKIWFLILPLAAIHFLVNCL